MSTQTISLMHEYRKKAAVATIDNDSFIVIGGIQDESHSAKGKGGEKYLSSCEVYDGSSNTWTRLPEDMPEGRYDFGAATIGRHIYVVGGKYSITPTMVAYSLDEKKWVLKKRLPGYHVDFAVAACNGQLFALGGAIRRRTERNSEVYDPETDSWEFLPPMPNNRFRSAAVTVDDKIYVMGGRIGEVNDYRYLSSVDIFNVTKWKWEKGPRMPTQSYDHAATVVGKFIVVTGGRTRNGKVLSHTQIYDVNKKKWSNGPSMTTGRYSHIATMINENRVVVAGGCGEKGNLNTAEAITFNLSNTTSHVQRPINQLEKNNTISLSSRIRKLEKELGVSVKGSLRERIQNMEKEIYGSIRKGALAIRLGKLETDTFC